ncbi:hypothetical protein INR49_023551 [Caranx melampygus]|nr:hypothetical protein INR49_023551 [Caranx melampygus]
MVGESTTPPERAASGVKPQEAVMPEPDLDITPWSSSAGDGQEKRGSCPLPPPLILHLLLLLETRSPGLPGSLTERLPPGSMLITEKATAPSSRPCSSTPAPAARGNRGPATTSSWSAMRTGGIKRSSIPKRRGGGLPRPHHRAQVRMPPPWRHRGTSPARCPVI